MVFETLVLLGNIASYFFVWSYKTGKFIVSALCFIGRSVYVSTEKLCYLSRILVGDFELFVQDVSRTTNNIVNSVGEIYNDYLTIVGQVIKYFIEYFIFIANGIRYFLTSVYFALEETVILILNFVNLIGPALWFLVTLPHAVFQLIIHCLYYLKNNLHELFVGTQQFFHNVYNGVVKIPAETCTGLTILIIFLYSVVKCRKLITFICRKFLLFLFSFLNSNILKVPLKMLRIVFVKSKPIRNEYREDIDDSHICIICQSNPRSIVLLPCRHLCLCEKCSNELVRYRTTNCPVCRQETNLKLRVYL